MRNAQHGIAIVTVLLVTAIALMIFLFASATLTVTSRSAVASERNSTQALLAADSGLKTLKARTGAAPYQASDGSFKSWIESNFAELDLGGSISARLTVLAEAADRLTVQSVGSAGLSTRTLVQEFVIVRGDPVPASVNIPGALTSVGAIDSNSNALCVNGKANTVADWEVTHVVTGIGNGNVSCANLLNDGKVEKRTANLCDARPDGYVVVRPPQGADTVFRAVRPDDCDAGSDVELHPIGGGAPLTMKGSTTARIRPTAIAEQLTVAHGPPQTSVVAVSSGTPSLFNVGSPITIGNDSTGRPSMGTVVAVDGSQLTIKWEPGKAPSGFQPPGTIVRRAISSGITEGSCPQGQGTFPDGCRNKQDGVDLANLFHKTFGRSKEDLKAAADTRIYSGDAFKNQTLSGISWVVDPPENFRDQKGSGILIIEADGKAIDMNVANNFTGLIYIIGNAHIQGNSQFKGAVIVDGSASINVQGTGGIFYDPLELMRALAEITFPNPDPGALGLPLADTWRIR